MSAPYPRKKFEHAGNYFRDYLNTLFEASQTVNEQSVNDAAACIRECFDRGGILYVCGNGGSAAISNHMTCDVLKCIQTDTDIIPRIISLSNNIEMITAISNDIAYEEVFAYQLRTLAVPGDVLITISASGNSENIVRAIAVAKEKGMPVISMTGFDGGRSAKEADINIHFESDNYGIIEDLHQSTMHTLAQYLRMQGMPLDLIAARKF